MYVKTVKAERIPSIGGRARIYPSGYVYWITESKWDKALKRTVDDRVCIGKRLKIKMAGFILMRDFSGYLRNR